MFQNDFPISSFDVIVRGIESKTTTITDKCNENQLFDISAHRSCLTSNFWCLTRDNGPDLSILLDLSCANRRHRSRILFHYTIFRRWNWRSIAGRRCRAGFYANISWNVVRRIVYDVLSMVHWLQRYMWDFRFPFSIFFSRLLLSQHTHTRRVVSIHNFSVK